MIKDLNVKKIDIGLILTKFETHLVKAFKQA